MTQITNPPMVENLKPFFVTRREWSSTIVAGAENVIWPVHNTVRDYGASGDDSTDDTTPLTNAFNAASLISYSIVYLTGISRYNSASELALSDGMKITSGGIGSGIRFTGTVEGLTGTTSMRILLDDVSLYG